MNTNCNTLNIYFILLEIKCTGNKAGLHQMITYRLIFAKDSLTVFRLY